MSSQPPQLPNQQHKDGETDERLDSIEDRLGELEEQERLKGMEERLQDLEQGAGGETLEENQRPAEIEGEGEKALRLAFAAFLNNLATAEGFTGLVKSIGDATKQHFELKAKEIEAQKRVSLRMFYVGLGFSAFILVALSALVWHDKITKELFAGLVGSLIGYWYGRERR